MKNKPYDKEHNFNSLGSDLTTAIQNFHYAGEGLEKIDDEKKKKDKTLWAKDATNDKFDYNSKRSEIIKKNTTLISLWYFLFCSNILCNNLLILQNKYFYWNT